MERWQDRGQRPEVERSSRGSRTDLEWVRSEGVSLEDAVGVRPRLPPRGAQPGPRRRRTIRSALSARDAVRQAIVLGEILGPPKALQPPATRSPF